MGRIKVDNYIPPMLAKETDKPFSDSEWIYEMKWDGFRAIAEVNKTKVQLYSRNGNSFNDAYPIVVEALKKLNIKAVLDGEIVIMDEDGRTNFQKLQFYHTDKEHVIQYRVFDVLEANGKKYYETPLIERKTILKKLLPGSDVIFYSDHIKTKGEEFFALAQQSDLEGIMAKRADSLYYPGVRTSNWLKIKHHKTTEAVIAGFTEPTGSRQHFGALVLGIYEGKELIYVGHTGSGFNTKTLHEMSRKLAPLVQPVSPFATRVKTNTPVAWVKPQLVAEIKYTEWTRDKILRHPIFLRLRDDKKAKDVTMAATKPMTTEKPKRKTAKKSKVKPTKVTTKKKSEKVKKPANPDKERFYTFGKIKVRTSNPNKIYFPEDKVTKSDVIDYYISVSKYILPYLKDRPESLKRNPNGIRDFGFFHKDAGDEAPSWVKSVPLYSESTGKNIDYIICNNQATLTYMNNLGCIEINPWHSTVRKPDHPDYLIIDIDPSDKNTFDQVIEVANVVNDILQRAGATGYCKTSGASGLHVYIPAGKKYTYEQLKDFAHLICMLVEEELPDFTTLERNLKKRGNKHIYLDHLQNRKGQTISSVYSLRPKPGATVSMPLKWSEVKPGLKPTDFHIHNALERIKKTGDLFKGVLAKGIDLQKCLKRLGS